MRGDGCRCSSYSELLEWVNKEFSKDIKYITLVKYTQRHFGSKIKVARKNHVKKDDALVETFKKAWLFFLWSLDKIYKLLICIIFQ